MSCVRRDTAFCALYMRALNFNHATGYDHIISIPGLKLIHFSKADPWESSEDAFAWTGNHISQNTVI